MLEKLEALKWKIVRSMGERGRAAAYWAGNKDTRPFGSDALWYDTGALVKSTETTEFGSEVQERHFHLTMRDGAKIALSLFLPEQIPSGKMLPTLINQTCYWRCYKIKWPFNLLVSGAPYFVNFFVPRGYAYIIADVRGTGASSGDRPYNRTKVENEDVREIIDWVISQPWSNGKVGTEGVSYMGASAAMSAAVEHPALKAVVPQFALNDTYEEFLYPGGILCERIIKRWSDQAVLLQRGDPNNGSWLMGELVDGVRSVDDDKNGTILGKILAGHADNANIYDVITAARFRDSVLPGVVEDGMPSTHDLSTPYAYTIQNSDESPAFYEVAGWFDGAFLRGNINRYLERAPDKKNKFVIGPWDHGGAQNISPWSNSRRSASSRLFEMLRFFDYHLKGEQTGVYDEPSVHYFTMGEEKWKSSDTWPPRDSQLEPFYLAKDRQLSATMPDGLPAEDEYTVDFSVTTGLYNRWQTIANFGNRQKEAYDIEYPDRLSQQYKMLTYTTAPLQEDVEVTGHPVMTLFMSSTTSDAAVHVYLEDVGPGGDFVYVTEGMLRASRRACGEAPYTVLTPYHSHCEADSQPMVPGEATEIKIELFPTSYLFAKGRSIRIGIAGADCDTFERIPNDGTIPVFHVVLGGPQGSFIELPIVKTRD